MRDRILSISNTYAHVVLDLLKMNWSVEQTHRMNRTIYFEIQSQLTSRFGLLTVYNPRNICPMSSDTFLVQASLY